MMRADKEVLKELEKMKIVERESYNDVLKRILKDRSKTNQKAEVFDSYMFEDSIKELKRRRK